MASPFVAEIKMFAGNFAPTGWATCDGQLLPISQNTALFSLLGTFYGGDGKSTFALPNLQNSSPMAPGQGPGLSLHDLGETGGSETVTLLESEIPAHTHSMSAAQGDATARLPGGELPATGIGVGQYAAAAGGGLAQLAPQAAAPAGDDLPHNNLMPYLALNFCIALQGVYPAFD